MSTGELPSGISNKKELREYLDKLLDAYFKNIPDADPISGNVTVRTEWERPIEADMREAKCTFRQSAPERLVITLSNNWKTGAPVRVEDDA